MVGEGIVYCLQSKLKGRGGAEGSINAGGCNFNSFLRRTVRFVGRFGCGTFVLFGGLREPGGARAPLRPQLMTPGRAETILYPLHFCKAPCFTPA